MEDYYSIKPDECEWYNILGLNSEGSGVTIQTINYFREMEGLEPVGDIKTVEGCAFMWAVILKHDLHKKGLPDD